METVVMKDGETYSEFLARIGVMVVRNDNHVFLEYKGKKLVRPDINALEYHLAKEFGIVVKYEN